MLIQIEEIIKVLLQNNIHIQGSFHVGAHECEELAFYNQIGLKNEDVVWVEAIPSKANEAKNRGIPNVYNSVITDKDDETVIFNIFKTKNYVNYRYSVSIIEKSLLK